MAAGVVVAAAVVVADVFSPTEHSWGHHTLSISLSLSVSLPLPLSP